MAVEVILPRVDMDMEAGKIAQWFVAEGEAVAKGQPLFEIETDKAAMEIEAPAAGVLRGVIGKPGETFPVGAVVGWIYAPTEIFAGVDAAAPTGPEPAAAEATGPAAPSEVAAVVVADDASEAVPGVRATPKARRLAHEAGLDIAAVTGSGPLGRVQGRDVEARVERAPAPALVAASARALHCEWLARGEGAPIVLVHGFGADLNAWRPLLGYFAPGRGALAVDLPGHGQSPFAEETSLEALADALASTLAAEGVAAAHLVGHSLGGAVAAAYAASRPADVRSLTLLSPAGLGPDINGGFIAGFLAARSEAGLAAWVRLLAVQEAALGSAMVKTTLRQRREAGVGETQGQLAAAMFPDGAQAFSIRARLSDYPGPAKIVFGAEDQIIPARHARGLPGAIAVHLFAQVGHMPHFEARAEVALLIQDNVAAGERRIRP